MKQVLQCIIIEDEPIAMEIMQDYIRNIPQLKLMAAFSDALYAMEYLRTHSVDLIFLDLHLPKLAGFDFLKSLRDPPNIIVTTAYHQHALEGFELNVVDYLLKPIEFGRLVQAVNKVSIPSTENKISERVKNEEVEESFRFFNVNKRMVKVDLRDIYFVESLKEYVKIHLKDRHLVTHYQIGEFQNDIHPLELLRIHRSYLVSVSKIDSYSSASIEVNGVELPIGRTYKNEVLQRLAHL